MTALFVLDLLATFLIAMRVNLYGLKLQDRIREDRRFETDQQWSQRARAAILLRTVDSFCLREGLIDKLPNWYRPYRWLFVGGVISSYSLGMSLL